MSQNELSQSIREALAGVGLREPGNVALISEPFMEINTSKKTPPGLGHIEQAYGFSAVWARVGPLVRRNAELFGEPPEKNQHRGVRLDLPPRERRYQARGIMVPNNLKINQAKQTGPHHKLTNPTNTYTPTTYTRPSPHTHTHTHGCARRVRPWWAGRV